MATNTGTQANGTRSGKGGKKKDTAVKTWSFDSVGPRKYALQIRKASNGNPYLKLVEGIPQEGIGEFRKFHITVWSEDFERFWQAMDAARTFMKDNDIKTPPGHKYEPGKKKKKKTTTKSK